MSENPKGQVVLVGGGPGDPDLLTLRAARELAAADVVVADRLGPAWALDQLAPQSQVINVGKQPYHHPIPQEQINQLLIEYANQGKHVVRLKGGDPYLLGRGGEEWLACTQAGVEVSVVPGISSAIAGPAAANIPVTQRGVSAGVLTISGHDELQPELLAQWPHTIVVLMGMARLPELTANLIEAGKSVDTPAAVVQEAWTPQQRSVVATLESLAAQVQQQGLRNPAVIVIGDVVTSLQPTRRKPARSE